jgi:hypothetical protein
MEVKEMSYSYKIDKEALMDLLEDIKNGYVKEIYDIEITEDGYCEVITDKAYYLITEQGR